MSQSQIACFSFFIGNSHKSVSAIQYIESKQITVKPYSTHSLVTWGPRQKKLKSTTFLNTTYCILKLTVSQTQLRSQPDSTVFHAICWMGLCVYFVQCCAVLYILSSTSSRNAGYSFFFNCFAVFSSKYSNTQLSKQHTQFV